MHNFVFVGMEEGNYVYHCNNPSCKRFIAFSYDGTSSKIIDECLRKGKEIASAFPCGVKQNWRKTVHEFIERRKNCGTHLK